MKLTKLLLFSALALGAIFSVATRSHASAAVGLTCCDAPPPDDCFPVACGASVR